MGPVDYAGSSGIAAGPRRVFLSHTSDLGQPDEPGTYVAAAVAAVLRARHAMTDMAYFAARDASPAAYCADMVAQSDVYVGIIGLRYGTPVRDRPDISYTELEFETAGEHGQPRLVFLVREDSAHVAKRRQQAGHRARQGAFRRRLQDSGLTVVQVGSPAELELAVFHALVELGPTPDAPARLAEAQALLASMPTDILPDRAPLPAGSRMPLAPNPLFVGRGDELLQVATALYGGDTTVALGQVVASTGLGGLGKTQLAVELVHRYGRFFAGGVFWLSFVSTDEIPLQVAGCAGTGAMDLAPGIDDRPVDERVQRVRRAWQSAVPRLLVFDNCEDEELLDAWRPPSGGCRVLVTSRRSRWSPTLGVRALPLDVLPRPDSTELLRRYRPDLAPDDLGLDPIAQELGDLPLALHLAGSYLRAHSAEVSLRDYLAELQRSEVVQHASLLGASLDDSPSPTRHMQGVAQTFSLCLGHLDREREVDRIAIALLARVACMAPGELVPRDLLTKTLTGVDPIHRANGVQRLGSVGLLEEGESWVRAHRLVVHFVRLEDLDQSAQRSVDKALIELGADAVRGYLAGKVLAELIPHLSEMAIATENPLESSGPKAEERSRSRSAYGHFYLGVALARLFRPDEAITRLLHARLEFDRLNEPYLVAECLEWEAGARYLKEDPDALAIAEEALRQYRLLEPREPEVEARMLEHMGTILVRHHNYLRARDCYDEALQVAGARLDIARLARIYHGLGSCHGNLGDQQRAIDLMSRAVTLHRVENDIRPQSARFDLPRAEGDLGMWYLAQGDLGRAEPLFQAALDHLAETGVERMRSRGLLSMAELRQAQGRLNEALQLIHQAIELAARYNEQIALAMAHQQLGQVHAERGEPARADEGFERALAILDRAGLKERRALCLAAYDRIREERHRALK